MSEQCVVCDQHVAVPHGHHTTPQAYGGKHSQVVTLCPTCHNTIHAHGSAILAYIRSGGKTKIKSFYRSEEQEQKALPLVRAIVEGALQENSSKLFRLQLELPEDIYRCLRLLKHDTGLSSLNQTLVYCVTKVYNDTIGDDTAQSGERNEKRRSCHEMWGL